MFAKLGKLLYPINNFRAVLEVPLTGSLSFSAYLGEEKPLYATPEGFLPNMAVIGVSLGFMTTQTGSFT